MISNHIRNLLISVRDYSRRNGINAEFTFHREESSLIRIGNSAIALSTTETLSRLDVTVVEDRKSGTFGLLEDLVSEEQLRVAVLKAQEYCRTSPDKEYQPIFGRVEETIDDTRGEDPALAGLSPEYKADFCRRVIEALKPRGNYDFSGSWSSGLTELYYITTANDNEAYRRLTDGRWVMVLKEQARKWELAVEQGGKRLSDFSADKMIDEFQSLLPVYEQHAGYRPALGRQRIMFGPQAIADLVLFAAYYGFWGRNWEQQQSFTANRKPGDKLFSELITIFDDPSNPNVFGWPFDLNGKRRRPWPLVENGIFRNLMYDSQTAARYGRVPTGHELDVFDLVLMPGTAPAGLASGKELAGDALYIPQLHYVRVPTPSEGLLTGSSRFNAQLLRNGRAVAPLLSTRIADTIPNIFSQVVALSEGTRLFNISATYGRRMPHAVSVPDYMICDQIRVTDVAESF